MVRPEAQTRGRAIIRETTIKKGLALVALLLLACRPRDPVKETLAEIVRAAESQDAEGVGAALTAEFKGEGSDRAECVARVRQVLAGYQSLTVKLSDVTIERGTDLARATFRSELSGTPRQVGGLEGWLPRSSTYRFELRLVREGESWKVAQAAWSRAE